MMNSNDKTVNIKISKNVFNEKYLPYLYNDDRFLILYGGGSSGKSYFLGERYTIKLLSPKKCNLIIARKASVSNGKSTFPLMKQVINNWNIRKYFDINNSQMRIKCLLTGNEVIFVGLDDEEKIKSITFENGEVTDVWVEEATECTEKDINQLIIRQRGGKSKKQLTMSFNPISVNHWIKKKFVDTKRATLCHSTYKDNKFLTDEDRETLESFKDTDPYYYDVYTCGKWGVLGKTFFDSNSIQKRIDNVKEPIKVGYFILEEKNGKIINYRWIDDVNGYIKIFKEPIKGHPYVLGGDTAGEGSDFFTGLVIDNFTSEQVVTLKQEFDEDEYAKQIYCLGLYYNTALIGLEINFSTYPTKKLQELNYPKLYLRDKEDDAYDEKLYKYGFKTTKLTRPIILSILVEIFRDHPELINDIEILEEALTFIRNEKGRPEAASGAHDDLIMGLAITYYIRTQQSYIIETDTEEIVINLPFALQTDDEESDEIVRW